MTLAFERNLAAQLAYDVLAQVDLGRDAANIHDGRPSSPAWGARLRTAYLEAGPERLEIQFAGLAFREPAALLEHARRREVESPLWSAFAEALEAEAPRLEDDFRASQPRELELIELRRSQIQVTIQTLRRRLWAPTSPPPLTVLHVPALRSHGRGYPRRGFHRVAVSLARPWEQVLIQIFHEEVHPVSDRELGDLLGRDTRAGNAGSALHRRVEEHAIFRGGEVIAAAAPALSPHYWRWARSLEPSAPQGAHTLR